MRDGVVVRAPVADAFHWLPLKDNARDTGTRLMCVGEIQFRVTSTSLSACRAATTPRRLIGI
jgi:hypothetical protein